MKIETKDLDRIGFLTEYNNHTQARIKIASMFGYLKGYQIALESIDRIHNWEGSLPFPLMSYREDLTGRMFAEIERLDGEEIATKLAQCL